VTFAPTDEQRELAQVVRKFLDDKAPPSTVRRLMESSAGFDTAVWEQMAKELGLQSLHIPEAYGGMGFGFVELGLVLEETGRALLCAPYLSSIALAANAVLNAGTPDQCAELLPDIAAGQIRAALAIAETSDIWEPGGIVTEARSAGDGYRLSGVKTSVVDGHTADMIVVVARDPGSTGADGIGFFVVDSAADGLTRTPLPTLDQTRKLARLDLDGVPARRLEGQHSSWSAVLRTLRQAAVCLAAEQVGGAQRCLDMAVDYAKVRTQFGRAIGSFQAIKHRCADMLLEVETARSAAYHALAVASADAARGTDGADASELGLAASMARSHCSEIFSKVASDNIQVHGGVGFTWEHDAHLYLKRARSSEVLLGGVSRHRELVAQYMGL
jgi:alkylation response protein AidB-like acyl-CoA dehydrogenase